MTDNVVDEENMLISYESLSGLRKLQETMLSLDWRDRSPEDNRDEESILFQKFSVMLDSYQEQPYLLDPYLEELVGPVVERLKEFARLSLADPNLVYDRWRTNTTAQILYSYVKFRGYKTIIRFFPHEIADLSIALGSLQQANGLCRHRFLWSTRYFDEPNSLGKTANDLETVAKEWIGSSGLDREAAALLLSRLYTRSDTAVGFHDFVESTHSYLGNDANVFKIVGMLQVICEVIKSGSVEQVQSELNTLLSIARIIQESSFSNNTVIRKYRIKLVSRLALRLLPSASGQNRRQARTLVENDQTSGNAITEEEVEVPSEVEDILELVLQGLQDRDTIVRWSAAKGIARIAERLPKDFCAQVLETIMGLFEIHSAAAATLYDIPAIAEATWHGACLACAEIARRSLIEPEYLPQLIDWLSKAIYFDLRKGAHSIGSSVRDAAAYVLWALARSQNQASLVPHASNLAQRLVAVALFDREIHIRRAASAAFQEHVGRTGLFPHGIDVLGKTDFYAVSVRKNAFLVAAPEVAIHLEYRDFLFNHLIDVVLRHWDIAMRELGAQSLRLLISLDLHNLAPRAIEKIVQLMQSLDMTDVHGGLSTLSEIAIAYKEMATDPTELEGHLRNVFKHLKHVPESSFTTTRNELIVSAACRLIGNSITVTEINLGEKSIVPYWRKIVDIGLKHRITGVQENAAAAMASMTNLTDCTAEITR